MDTQKSDDIQMVPDDEAGNGADPQAKLAKAKEEGKRFEEFAKFANADLIADIVQALDSFDLALGHEMPKDVERGIILIRSQLEDMLRKRGLEVIHAKGERFDPALHESVGEVETEEPEGMVVEELQKGYRLGGKVIRPARVKIAKSLSH